MSGRSKNTEWYADGLRFSCTQCGNCCTGPPGFVWFTDDEAAALADRFDMTVREFRKMYARKIDGGWSLGEVETEHGFDCIFLDRSTGAGRCSVYEDRPTQCRTWPFWPENLRTERTWELVKRQTPCPGMGAGTLVPIEQIRIIRDQQTGEP
ncbi:MAG: YkgJ family cysteine cluster protein [Phycisphaerales bacterium]|nr:YkgJ family cysteine cluster protein [Phycisphaerales bacterium]